MSVIKKKKEVKVMVVVVTINDNGPKTVDNTT